MECTLYTSVMQLMSVSTEWTPAAFDCHPTSGYRFYKTYHRPAFCPHVIEYIVRPQKQINCFLLCSKLFAVFFVTIYCCWMWIVDWLFIKKSSRSGCRDEFINIRTIRCMLCFISEMCIAISFGRWNFCTDCGLFNFSLFVTATYYNLYFDWIYYFICMCVCIQRIQFNYWISKKLFSVDLDVSSLTLHHFPLLSECHHESLGYSRLR